MTTETEKVERPEFNVRLYTAEVATFLVGMLIVMRLALGIGLDIHMIDTEKAWQLWNAGCKVIAMIAVAMVVFGLIDVLPRLFGTVAKAKNDAKESEG